MFVWTLNDAIFVALLCIAAILLVLAWLFFWIGRLIAWIKSLRRHVGAMRQKLERRFNYVWGS